MKTFVAICVLALALPVVAAHHNENHGNNGTIPSMPDSSIFGLCTAYEHNENGREHGNAGNAGPFVWLAQQAEAEDQTVEEFCADRAPGRTP